MFEKENTQAPSKRAFRKVSASDIAWFRLVRSEGVGNVTLKRLIARFTMPENAVSFLETSTKFSKIKLSPLSKVEDEIAAIEKAGATFLCSYEDIYPQTLLNIADAPPILTVLGNPAFLHRPSIGVVGTRNASLNGKKMTVLLSQELAKANYIITSGMARGIDTAAHQAALDAGYPSIAVLAGGADYIYPQENKKLYARLIEEGAVISESPMGMSASAKLFPRRNRIVSGLSAGIIVVEAALRSGSLITARLALEQGREVYAVPGSPMDPRAQGPNSLIQQGAKLALSAQDIVEDLKEMTQMRQAGLFSQEHYLDEDEDFDLDEVLFDETSEAQEDVQDEKEGPAIDQSQPLDQRILKVLSTVPTDIDEVIRNVGAPAQEVQTALIQLEIFGKIHRVSGNRVALLHDVA